MQSKTHTGLYNWPFTSCIREASSVLLANKEFPPAGRQNTFRLTTLLNFEGSFSMGKLKLTCCRSTIHTCKDHGPFVSIWNFILNLLKLTQVFTSTSINYPARICSPRQPHWHNKGDGLLARTGAYMEMAILCSIPSKKTQ